MRKQRRRADQCEVLFANTFTQIDSESFSSSVMGICEISLWISNITQPPSRVLSFLYTLYGQDTHISNICTKANRTLGFLRRTLFSCPQNVKEAAYKGMVRPILEYGSSVWDPHPDKLQKELEKVQNRAARFVTRNYDYETGSMTGILGQLKWESLKKRRKDSRLILLYKGLKGKAKIPTDDLIPKTRRGRNQHSLAFQIPSASKDVYMYSFFPQTIRDWNDLPESLISSSEMSDDSVSKFTSLVRARD